jgi:hypothetical protein
MNEEYEAAYQLGHRSAWVGLLQTALRALGYEGAEFDAAKWAVEREAAIAALRSLCADYGDNDWDSSLHLADVIEEHLVRHLEAPEHG